MFAVRGVITLRRVGISAVKTGCAECALHTGPEPHTILWSLKKSNAQKCFMIRGLKIILRVFELRN